MDPNSYDGFHLNALAACAQFATAIAAWGDVVRVAAVDCAERENVVIVVILKGRSHEMDLAFFDMHGQFKALIGDMVRF
jgi:hypothetical protein